jgi:Poly(3-hydroxybutyrate) depolymerase
MIDTMNEIVQFSPFGGELILEPVAGTNNSFKTAENSVFTSAGRDRDMYSYVPASGCYDDKQGQILMVLRDENTKESAEMIIKDLRLDELAEKKHFVLLFPNPQEEGWNYEQKTDIDDDLSFLVRCFATLPKSKGGVAGFNGMIFYIGVSEAASALLALLSAEHPIDCSAAMLSSFPEGFAIGEGKKQPQVAWIYGENKAMEDYLNCVDQPVSDETVNGVKVYTNGTNTNSRYFVSGADLSAEEVQKAWDMMFSEARRWRNDTYGTYQKRTNFTEEGFIGHVGDDSLGVNNGFKHTWYEYIPPRLRGTDEKVPLLFYFHGGNCIPLYGAEQSDWHRIAEREGFIVVYPKASTKKRWNCWNDAEEPSDFEFVMALIDHMKEVHPIDSSRIYISGFSMGSMMTNALACAYPEVFAAAAPCNAQHLGYFKNIYSTFTSFGMKAPVDISEEKLNEISPCRILADKKKAEQDYCMPVIQSSGLIDELGMKSGWPIRDKDDIWLQTIDFWKNYNHIPVTEFQFIDEFETGLTSDCSFYECEDQRFIHHRWYSNDECHIPLYEFLAAKRMPHAVDLRQFEIAWEYIRQFSRSADGSLKYVQSKSGVKVTE